MYTGLGGIGARVLFTLVPSKLDRKNKYSSHTERSVYYEPPILKDSFTRFDF